MSRRHHGRPHHARQRGEAARPGGSEARPISTSDVDAPRQADERPAAAARAPRPPQAPRVLPGERIAAAVFPVAAAAPAEDGRDSPPTVDAAGRAEGARPASTQGHTNGHAPGNGCTAPQLRRFIKSRPYVPMHELRRRFGIAGTDDDVTQVRLEEHAIYVGLPAREGALLGELLRGGEIGCELSLDPRTPVVVGVYPMRPVPRS